MRSKPLLLSLVFLGFVVAGLILAFWNEENWNEPSWLETEYVSVSGSTGCHPVSIPGEVCPDALSWDEMMQVRGVLDMCAPRKWIQNTAVTDRGYVFETGASNIDQATMDCLKRYLSNKVTIERIRH